VRRGACSGWQARTLGPAGRRTRAAISDVARRSQARPACDRRSALAKGRFQGV
jgi:hypothetical protein